MTRDPSDLATAYYAIVLAGLVADDPAWATDFASRLQAYVAARRSQHDALSDAIVRAASGTPRLRDAIEEGAPWSKDFYEARTVALELGLFTRLEGERPISPARVVAAFAGDERVALAQEAAAHAVREYFLPALVDDDERSPEADSLVEALAAVLPEDSAVRASVQVAGGVSPVRTRAPSAG